MQQPIRMRVCHADPLIAAGARAALAGQPGLHVVDAGTDADVLLADYDGALARLAENASAHTGVLVLTWRDGEAEIRHALQCTRLNRMAANNRGGRWSSPIRMTTKLEPQIATTASANRKWRKVSPVWVMPRFSIARPPRP